MYLDIEIEAQIKRIMCGEGNESDHLEDCIQISEHSQCIQVSAANRDNHLSIKHIL